MAFALPPTSIIGVTELHLLVESGAANADGQRRRLDPVGHDLSPLPPTGLAPLLRELLAEYAATGMPPAYLASTEPTAAPASPATPTNPTEANPA